MRGPDASSAGPMGGSDASPAAVPVGGSHASPAVALAQLRSFVAVVDAGGFGAAAGRLGLSQSAVSHAVAALERATGRPVLTRLPRPVPTLFGERILEHARAALAAEAAILDLAAADAGGVRGHVAVGAMSTACHALLPALLVRWRAELPAVTVSLFEGEDDEVADWLAGGSVELAVLVNPASGGVEIGVDEFAAVLRTDHPLAGQARIDVADLADDPYLLSDGGCEPYLQRLHRMARTPFAPAHRVRQMSTLLDMVRAGIGVSVVPGLTAALLGPGLVLVPLVQWVTRRLVLSGPAHRPWHPAARALLEHTRP